MYTSVAVSHLHGIDDVETAFGARHGHIEFPCVFFVLLPGLVVDIRVASVGGIVDDDIVELQSFRLVYGRHIDTLTYAPAVAEVGFFQCVDIHHVT